MAFYKIPNPSLSPLNHVTTQTPNGTSQDLPALLTNLEKKKIVRYLQWKTRHQHSIIGIFCGFFGYKWHRTSRRSKEKHSSTTLSFGTSKSRTKVTAPASACMVSRPSRRLEHESSPGTKVQQTPKEGPLSATETSDASAICTSGYSRTGRKHACNSCTADVLRVPGCEKARSVVVGKSSVVRWWFELGRRPPSRVSTPRN